MCFLKVNIMTITFYSPKITLKYTVILHTVDFYIISTVNIYWDLLQIL